MVLNWLLDCEFDIEKQHTHRDRKFECKAILSLQMVSYLDTREYDTPFNLMVWKNDVKP